jgi:uncharacterized protein (TIGR02145 family)
MKLKQLQSTLMFDCIILFGIIFNSCKRDQTSVTVKDIDGNIYTTVTIGTQEWMAENLKVTHYRNGEAIPNITDNAQWNDLSTGAYCWYNNDEPTVGDTYGALYNWFTVVDSRNLCPVGWHIPSDPEWTTLTDYLGGEYIAGGKLKETGTIHWLSPNTVATNESGFTGLPGGMRTSDFDYIGIEGVWWSSTEYDSNYAFHRYIYYDSGSFTDSFFRKEFGFSVRCIKD